MDTSRSVSMVILIQSMKYPRKVLLLVLLGVWPSPLTHIPQCKVQEPKNKERRRYQPWAPAACKSSIRLLNAFLKLDQQRVRFTNKKKSFRVAKPIELNEVSKKN